MVLTNFGNYRTNLYHDESHDGFDTSATPTGERFCHIV